MMLTTLAGFGKAVLGWLTDWRVVLAACALASVAFGVWKVRSYQKEIVTLSEALSASQAAERAAVAQADWLYNVGRVNAAVEQSRNDKVVVIHKEAEKARAESVEVLKANPDWSDAPIPDAVLERLRKAGSTD